MKPSLINITSICALSLFLLACSPEQNNEKTAAAPNAADTPKGLDYAFYKAAVEPLFLRPRGGYIGSDAGCVACHTSQANAPLGLQALTLADGRVFWTEEQSRQNFVNVAKLVDPSDPDSSRLLNAPLAPAAGGERHSGGIFWDSRDHSEYRIIAEWIATGSDSAGEDVVPEMDYEFFRSCVQPIFVNPIENAMPCAECHSGEFAVEPPENSYWTEAQSRQAFDDLVYLIDPGRPDSSRFLHKPLHPNAGGDLMHNGGRRWFSKDDPERVALEDWVTGNASGSQCPPALQFDYPPRA